MRITNQVTAAIYVRVSTTDQNCDLQLHDLRSYCARIGWSAILYAEKELSARRRPVFERMLKDGRAGHFSVLLVWRIDRFARSMKDFFFTTMHLDQQKIRLISLTEGIDSGDQNPFADFQRKLLALLAELERKIIISRVNEGIAEAQRKGKHCGRPKAFFDRAVALRLRKEGQSVRGIAAQLGVPKSVISRCLAACP